MLPFVHVVRVDRTLADQPINTPLAPIANILDLDGWDFSVDSRHAPIIREPEKFAKSSVRN